MKKIISENRILALMLLIGLIASLVLCGTRAGLEQEHTGVSLIMSKADAETLAAAAGTDYESYSAALMSSGLSAVFTPGEVCRELNLYIGDSYKGETAVVGMPEDDRQYSHDEVEGFVYTPEAEVVRVFRLRPEYAARYASLGYNGPEEIENLTYRTITDRNIRIIWLTPFTRADNGRLISDINAYTSVIEGVGRRIEAHGLHLGQFSHLPPYTPNTALIFCVIAGIAAAGALLLGTLLPLSRKQTLLLTLVCFAAGSVINLKIDWLMPLAASIVYPCLGIYLTAQLMLRIDGAGRGKLIISYLIILLTGFAIALVGGNAIAALQSDRAWLLAVKNFRGVKISQALPLVYALIICLKVFYKGKSLQDILGEYRDKRIVAFAAVALVAVGAFYIARTGDGILDAGVMEQRFRNFLENMLIVRPRTKEFLAAWPALALATVLMAKGSRRYALPFTAVSAIGLASVVNTFCHSRSPLWLSLARSCMGILFGFILGAVIILLLAGRKKKSID